MPRYIMLLRGPISATANVISEEKMGIIIQEISGSEDGGFFFPTLSGTARSINFYPVGYEKPEEGIAKIAFGLGKAVVDGEQVLRFSPSYPKNVIQTSTPELALRDTQKVMYALNLQPGKFKTSVDDAVNLERIPISDCGAFKEFGKVVSTFDTCNGRIVDSPYAEGPKMVTFAHVLRYNTFPLAGILKELLSVAVEEMQSNVEIEFAADLQNNVFHLLQIRPISTDGMHAEVDWDKIDTGDALVLSDSALGTGWIPGVYDIVYVRRDTFDKMRTPEIAAEVNAINSRMRQEGRNYLLIGYGRWGSAIPTLGIPVVWSDISEAKALVECGMDGFRVDPSQGSHFFQNLTSFNVGYISTDDVDHERLASMPAVSESHFIRHIRVESPLQICVDGRTGKGLVKL